MSHVTEFPDSIQIEISATCNLRCNACFLNALANRDEDLFMAEPVFERVLEIVPHLKRAHFAARGEPLVNVNAVKMIERIKSVNPRIKLSLVTNGTLITEAMARKLCASGLDNITVSVDAAVPKMYESIRKGARFDALLRSLEFLRRSKRKSDHKTMLSINFVAMRSNIGELPGVLRLASKYGVGLVSVSGLVPYQEKYCGDVLYGENPGVETFYKYYVDAIRIAEDRNIKLLLPMMHLGRERVCMRDFCFVSAGGTVAPCENLICERTFYFHGRKKRSKPLIFGTLTENDFVKIYNASIFRKFRKGLLDGMFPRPCQGCLMSYGVICP